MAETVLQLHTTGWPHKGIRSENVLFFAAQAAELAEVAEQKAYLVGFEYARPDSKAGAAVTQLPDTPADTDLYRHPDARGALRKSYRKHFDLCSLGCLLLELVLWKPLIKVMTDDRDEGPDRSTKSLEPNGSEIQSSSLGSLNFAADKRLQLEVKRHVGPVFCEAIIRCFASGADDDSSLKQQEAILATLQRVNV
jgi:serine/threonine protein kinase